MISIAYLRICLRALITLLWLPGLAAAAVTVAAADAGTVDLPISLVVITAVLSTLSGATALVQRLDRELRATPGQPLPRPWLFCGAHMLGSWLAGALAFILAQHQRSDVWLLLGLVVVAAFMGAKFIEMGAERVFGRVLPPSPPTPGG